MPKPSWKQCLEKSMLQRLYRLFFFIKKIQRADKKSMLVYPTSAKCRFKRLAIIAEKKKWLEILGVSRTSMTADNLFASVVDGLQLTIHNIDQSGETSTTFDNDHCTTTV